MDEDPASSGTPQLGTETRSESTFDSMAAARKAEDVRMTDIRYAVWNTTGKFWHLFRWHIYVPLEEWDMETGSMRYAGLICWHCQKRRG
jgi:hypothetical protein